MDDKFVVGLMSFCVGVIIGLLSCHMIITEGAKVNRTDYESACILSDIVRNTIDNYPETEELYREYVDNLDSMNLHITEDDLNSYSWCY